jgi:hypothetical protein
MRGTAQTDSEFEMPRQAPWRFRFSGVRRVPACRSRQLAGYTQGAATNTFLAAKSNNPRKAAELRHFLIAFSAKAKGVEWI